MEMCLFQDNTDSQIVPDLYSLDLKLKIFLIEPCGESMVKEDIFFSAQLDSLPSLSDSNVPCAGVELIQKGQTRWDHA